MENREKRTIIVKQPTSKASGRVCLNCGISIDNRTKKVNFCCPACKAAYKERQWLDEQEEKNTKRKKKNKYFTNPDALPYSSYNTSQVERFNQKYGSNTK